MKTRDLTMEASPSCHEAPAPAGAASDGAPKRGLWTRRVLVVMLLAFSGLVDYTTGTEVSVFLLYLMPVMLATRWLGAGAGTWAALGAGAVWVLADVACGHVYSHEWILWINAANRLVTFLLAVVLVAHVSRDRDQAVQRWQGLTQSLSACQRCDKVRAQDGQWRTPLQHLEELGGAQIQTKVCADCARRSYARAAYLNDENGENDEHAARSA
jgi:hypothetical protein